jgi:hypothetical protein
MASGIGHRARARGKPAIWPGTTDHPTDNVPPPTPHSTNQLACSTGAATNVSSDGAPAVACDTIEYATAHTADDNRQHSQDMPFESGGSRGSIAPCKRRKSNTNSGAYANDSRQHSRDLYSESGGPGDSDAGAAASDTNDEPPQSYRRRRSAKDIADAEKRRLEKSLSLFQLPRDTCGHGAPSKRQRSDSEAPSGHLRIDAAPMQHPETSSRVEMHSLSNNFCVGNSPIKSPTTFEPQSIANCISTAAPQGVSSDSLHHNLHVHGINPATLRHRPPN